VKKTQKRTLTDHGYLYAYETGDAIRPATRDEQAESTDQAARDGGAGVISVEIDGQLVRCYVQD